MPIWLAGVAAYRYCRTRQLQPRTGLLLFWGSAAGWLLYEIVVWRYGRPLLQPGPYFKRAEVAQDYIVAALFVAHIVGFNAAAPALGAPLLRAAAAIRVCAGVSFTLYLCHLPIAQFLLACSPWPPTDARSRMVVFFGTLAAVFLLAQVTEKQKNLWRRGIQALWPRARQPLPR
jgi:peptidoglycan/LPS O-acetylase OafA/YrhL